MKTTIDIIEALYQIINVPNITNLINGKVYSTNVPNGNKKENITIKTLANSSRYLQQGYLNVNVYVPELQSGRPDIGRFKQIINVLIPLIKNVKSRGCSYQIDDDKGIFKDNNTDGMCFYNLKLKFQAI